jgi:uncharacterized protein YdeI (BOF family)
MRSTLIVLIALAMLALSACADGVEQPPAADAPEGTESGGAVVGTTELAMEHFGSAFTLTDSVKAKELLADPAAHADKTILVEGTVVDVSQGSGSWLVLSDGGNQIRVIMKDNGFSVNEQGIGAWVKIEGRLEAIDLDPDTVARLIGESTRPELMPEQAGAQWQLVATGVAMEKRP